MRVFLHGTGPVVLRDRLCPSPQKGTEENSDPAMKYIMKLLQGVRKKDCGKRVPWRSRENTELPLFDLTTVAKPLVTSQAATSWEKVALDLCTRRDDIAVKRLSKNSGQEMREFKNW